MTDKQIESGHTRAKRNSYIQLLQHLAAKMENEGLNKTSNSVILPENNNEHLKVKEYKIQAGKILFEAFQSGEFHENGVLCHILDYWTKISHLQSAEWCYVQGFESVCWEWFGKRFGEQRIELGELCACVHVIRLLTGELERQNIE